MSPSRAPRSTPWLSRDEQRHFLATVQQGGVVRDLALLQLALHTGVRIGELCALTWGDVQLTAQQGSLKVLGSPTTYRGGRSTLPREIPLNTTAREALLALGYARHQGTSTPVCMGRRGPLTEHGINVMFGNYARTAQLHGVTFGTLRHTFCRNLAEAGADVRSIATLAGHPTLEAAWRYLAPSSLGLAQIVELLPDETGTRPDPRA